MSTLLILLICGAFYAYALFYKPEIVAIILFALMIANINIDLKGLPLNSRAIITITLFGRILFDKQTRVKYNDFLGVSTVKAFIFYFLYFLFISFSQDLFTIELLKVTISTILAAFCVYHYFFKNYDDTCIKIGLIISGIICFVDLAYTYAFIGSFPVRRIYELVNSGPVEDFDPNNIFVSDINHNFFGQVCGMAFVFVFTDIVKNRLAGKYLIVLLPLMFIGVLMSTSRSALMAIIVVVLFVVMKSINYREGRKKVLKIVSFSVAAATIGILLFSTISMYFNLDSKFVDEVLFRLVDEPIAILQRAMGQNYNIQNLGSMDWREEAAAQAYDAYMNLPVIEQIFGIGNNGFIVRNLGHGLNPHNGVLLILIEVGLVGFLIYLMIILGVIIQSIRLGSVSPSLAVLLFIIIFGIGQNNELTSVTTFLFVFTMIAENQYILAEKRKQVVEVKKVMKIKMGVV